MTVLEIILIITNVAALFYSVGYCKLYKNLKEQVKTMHDIEQNDKTYIKALERKIKGIIYLSNPRIGLFF